MKKKISLISAIILFAMFVQAQGISFGLRGGVNFQNINGSDANDNTLKNDILIGYHIGVNAEIPIVPEFYFQPGLLYTLKGNKSEDVFAGQTINSTTKISYLELDLNFLYKPLLGNGHLLLGFGPYVGYGIGGNVKNEGGGLNQTEDIKFKNTIEITDPQNVTYVRPLDIGANLLAGYEFGNKISFQLNAQLGLVKINPEEEGITDDKSSAKNTGFGFSLGYRF